ncbi:TAXI family TRAP transporter solute-binding subunit [Brucella abortus]|nr:TAXI family TRAP transporter solute-binding subunit [Brucella abortus]
MTSPKVLWNEDTRKALDAGHAKGKLIKLDSATSGLGIPLHPGAERFYKEAGVRNNPSMIGS